VSVCGHELIDKSYQAIEGQTRIPFAAGLNVAALPLSSKRAVKCGASSNVDDQFVQMDAAPGLVAADVACKHARLPAVLMDKSRGESRK
jgi:hypothetical protein